MEPISTLILLLTIAISMIALYGKRDLTKYIFYPYEIKIRKRWYQFISAGFLHADFMHLFFNMLTLYFFAGAVENAVGGINFCLIYFGSMIFAHLPGYIKHRNDPQFRSLGASGAVSGIIFASILFNPYAKMMIMPIPIPISAPIFGLLYLVYCSLANKFGRDNINHSAHLWGAVAGILLTIIIDPSSIGFFLGAILN